MVWTVFRAGVEIAVKQLRQLERAGRAGRDNTAPVPYTGTVWENMPDTVK